MAISEEILLKIKKQQQDSVEEIVTLAKTLALPTHHVSGHQHEDLVKRHDAVRGSLLLTFGQAAYDKARKRYDLLQRQPNFLSIFNHAGDIAIARMKEANKHVGFENFGDRMVAQTVNQALYGERDYKYRLSELFPSLKPAELKKVQAALEDVGFTFERKKITSNKFMNK